MAGWDDPTGWPWYAVGICDRCNRRFPLHMLIEDGNLPGLRVCRDDWDELDPYRLPARQPDNLVLPFVRPDVPIAVTEPSVPISLPTGFILTEDGLSYVIAQNGLFIVVEGVADILAENGDELATEDDDNLIVEPYNT